MMKDDERLSREDQVAQAIHEHYRHGEEYEIVDSAIPALLLGQGMVWQDGPRPRVITEVTIEKRESGSVVIIETASQIREVTADSDIQVWYLFQNATRKPFIMQLPDLPTTALPPPATKSGSTPPVHDAAGIVPVWMGPKRVN